MGGKLIVPRRERSRTGGRLGKRNFSRSTASVLLACSLITVSFVISPSRADAAGDGGLLSILVLGDSYSAGNGAGDIPGKAGDVGYYGSSGCWRNSYNYAREYQRIIEAEPFNQRAFVENRACSGAVTADFRSAQSGKGDDVVRQLDWVNQGYDLIFLTIGGNDLAFPDIAKFCLIQSFRDGANCGPNLTDAEEKLENGSLETDTKRVLEDIRLRAHPDAKIVLLGYPYLESDTSYRIRSGHFGSTFIEVGQRLRALSDNGNAMQQRVVDSLNNDPRYPDSPFVFVKTTDIFGGHELAAQSLNADRWFVQPWEDAGLRFREWWYHPNRFGHRAEAELLATDPRVPKSDQNDSGAPGSTSRLLDIVLTIDSTGSMLDDIAAVRSSSLALVDRVAASGANWQIGLVTYRDVPPQGSPGDYASRVDLGFSRDPNEIRDAINAISVGGGGDGPETVLSGINTAVGYPWRDGAKKAIIVLGDAPPHDPEQASGLTSAQVIAAALAVDPAEIYPVLISPSVSLDAAFRPLAEGTGGQVVSTAGGTDVVTVLEELLDDVATAPVANAGGPYGAEPGDQVYFTASASFDPDGTLTQYEWDVNNDGVYEFSSGQPWYLATIGASYAGLVSVRVTDNDGLQTVAQTPLVIAASQPTSEPAPPDIPGVLEFPCVGLTPTITGTEGPDTITGTPGDDIIFALGGNDHVDGRGGNDIICLGAGRDSARGGSGNDQIFGGEGRDEIEGNKGNDILDGGEQNDEISGGVGDDIITGAGGHDRLLGNNGADDITGGDGRDEIEGGKGNDTLDGGDHDDRLFGGGGNDTMTGGAGNDLLRGNGGDDHLDGGEGDDDLEAGGGNDTCLNGETLRGCEG